MSAATGSPSLIFPESASAHHFLDGLDGIEIGGSAHNPFNIPRCRNVDFSADTTTEFKRLELEYAGRTLPVDVVAEGDVLPFADESLEYVLHSHVFEHFWDPIGAVKEWLRVLRPGGIVFAIVPHKERTMDADRPRTTLAELIDRHAGRLRMPPTDAHIHHNVWITADVVELVDYLGLELLAVHDRDDKVGNGFTVVFRKSGTAPSLGPKLDLGCGAAKRPGSVGIDRRALPGVDLVLDLDRAPLPFADGTIPHVYSDALFSYLRDPAALLREIVRVCRPGAIVEIVTPHALHDGAALLGMRQRYAEATWVDLLAGDTFAGCGGNMTLDEITLRIRPAVVESLRARGIALDFALRHHANVVSRIGAVMTVHKPPAPPAGSYAQRAIAENG